MGKSKVCPFCKLEQSSRHKLIDHVLGEIHAHTLYVCGRCAFSKPCKEKDLLKDDQHSCWQGSYPFQVKTQNYTLRSVKEMLAKQGVNRVSHKVVERECTSEQRLLVGYA